MKKIKIRKRELTPEEKQRIEQIDSGFEVSPIVQMLTKDMQDPNFRRRPWNRRKRRSEKL